MGRGRRPEAELQTLRERIEVLALQGLRPAAIHRALTGPENPAPLVLSERQVRAHVRAVERGWATRASLERLDAERARAVAVADELYRTAMARSTRNANANAGVGYLSVALKAQERIARLVGLDGATRTELTGAAGGPLTVLAIEPLAHGPTNPADERARLALERFELDARIAALDEPHTAEESVA